MYWPTPQDYREAIQNPRVCFKDSELRSGLPEMDKFGLPRPISGSFASVYRLKCGEQEWAIRCFTNNVKDQKIRYDAISLHLKANPLPYLVPFEYLSEGININGQWFPVVKMQWVEGESLHEYIERNLHHADVLQELSDKWIIMIRELRSANIGHGDLQHGNIVMNNDEIILIDYDGMYVPALNGMPSNELGHRNYQHPGRNEGHFGSFIDHFSAWVVWLSITAVCADPTIWHSLKAGEEDECLLFRRNDFVNPDVSLAFEQLEHIEDHAVRSTANSLRAFAKVEVALVPSLPDPEWELKSAADPSPSERAYSGGASWVLDHIAIEPRNLLATTSDGLLPERLISCLIIIGAASTAAVLYSSAPAAALFYSATVGFGTEIAYLFWRFRKSPVVREKTATNKKINKLDLELTELRNERNEWMEIKRNFMIIEEDLMQDCVQRLAEAEKSELHETEAVEKELLIQLSGLLGERQMIDHQEKTELSGTLAAFQKTWMEEQLSKHKISQDKIPEIDDEMKRRLRSNNIRTPADYKDITINQSYGRKHVDKVYLILTNGGSVHVGMSRVQAKALIDWKRKIERRYRTKIPAALPRSESSAIALRYKDRKSNLNVAEQTYRTEAQDKVDAIKQGHRPELESLTKEVDAARIRLANELYRLDGQIDERNKSHSSKLAEYRDLNERIASYRNVHFISFVKQVFRFRNSNNMHSRS
ncbi:hypothetical protein [Paenibacillus sp. CF384]|uniref:hypothetical protein n=1 Tax=Paenibacillus sp. CF384 TaxID=1884382 RepID=UPI000896A6AE|nr:hypothetical protein [Paenibacillus sp. CF384]SDW06326.1 hypothetical protein SAMN05518855_1001132 [Paenibacillus sp. CF384]